MILINQLHCRPLKKLQCMTDALTGNGHQNIGFFCVCVWWISGSLCFLFVCSLVSHWRLLFFSRWHVSAFIFLSMETKCAMSSSSPLQKWLTGWLWCPHCCSPPCVVFLFAKRLRLVLLLMEFQCYISIDCDDGNYVALLLILLFQGQFSNPY